MTLNVTENQTGLPPVKDNIQSCLSKRWHWYIMNLSNDHFNACVLFNQVWGEKKIHKLTLQKFFWLQIWISLTVEVFNHFSPKLSNSDIFVPAKYDVPPRCIPINCRPSGTWCRAKKRRRKKAPSLRLRAGRLQGLLIILASAVLLIDPPELPPPESSLPGKKEINKKNKVSDTSQKTAVLCQYFILHSAHINSSTLGNRSRIRERQAAALPHGSWRSDVFVPPTSPTLCEWVRESRSKAVVGFSIESSVLAENGNSPSLGVHGVMFSHLGGAYWSA